MWMNLLLALAPLAAGSYAVVFAPLLALAMAIIEQIKGALAQTGELTAEEVAAFDAWLAERKASPEWQVRQ
jgi:hypothetical protein